MNAPAPRFAVTSPARRGELLTLGGQVICGHDAAQLEWLMPGAVAVPLPPSVPTTQQLPVWAHPDFEGGFDARGDVIRGRFRG